MYHETKRFLSENGYHRYEISNYALDGYECYHNKVYWMRGNYLGFGIGAASMVNDVRWSNIRDIDSYVGAFRKLDTNLSEVVITDKQILKKSECMEEFMFLGLRLVRGVGVKEFKENFGKSILEVYGNVIEKYKRMGLLEYDPEGRYLRLTDEGLDVSNTVMADFLLE
jgi:oxygen-independent coproporphyrinogen-3 oxidase